MKAKKKKSDKPKQKQVDTWEFDKKLPSGQNVRVKVQQTMEVVERKVKVEAGYRLLAPDYPVPIFINLRDASGKPVTRPVKVQGLRVTVTFADKTVLQARSCCKPPDEFNAGTARRRALHRLFLIDSGIDPANIKYEEIPSKKNPDETIRRMMRESGRKPRLNGDDRKSLFHAVLRNGKLPKEKKQAVRKTRPLGETAVG